MAAPKGTSRAGAVRKSAAVAAVAVLGVMAFRLTSALGGNRDTALAATEQRDDGASAKYDRARKAEGSPDLGGRGWTDIARRTYADVSEDRILLVAAGITFYGLLALFPALTALVSIAGFFIDPTRVVDQLQSFSSFLPDGALGIIVDQVQRIASQPTRNLSFAFLTGLGVALWSANNGIKAIFDGLNVVHGEREERSFLRLTVVSLLFTVGAIATIILALGAIIVIPAILGFVGLGGVAGALIRFGRWPVFFALIVIGIGLLYRFGPSRSPARWRWTSAGSLLAALLWVAASALFSWYVANFNSYNEIYGSLGAVIAFMVWMWISTTIILLGAELNSELERQVIGSTTAKQAGNATSV